MASQRKSRMRGILSKHLKSRNQSIVGEQYYRLKDKKMNAQASVEDIENKIREREKIKQ